MLKRQFVKLALALAVAVPFAAPLQAAETPASLPGVKTVSAEEWFKQGFVTLHTTDDCEAAVRAFAQCIRIDPTYERAYVNRGLAYERLGNVQQSIEDFTRAITVDAGDPKLYYLRGIAFRRLGMDEEAFADLKKSADMHYRPAHDLLKSLGIPV